MDRDGRGFRYEGPVRLDVVAVRQRHAASLRLPTLATNFPLSLLVVPLDFVWRELVEERGEVLDGGAEGLEKGGEEFAAKVVVRNGEAVDVAKQAKGLDKDVDLLANRVGDGGSAGRRRVSGEGWTR